MSNEDVINEKSQQRCTTIDSSADSEPSKLPFQVSEDVLAAAGFRGDTPIVNALIGNLTGSLPTKKSDATETVRCEICDCDISSSVIMNFHLNGAKHKKKLKALEIISNLKADAKNGVTIGDDDNPNNFRCEVCSLTVNSAQQLEFHLSGIKHQKNAFKAGLIEALPDTESESRIKSDSHGETQSESESRGKASGEESIGPPPPKIKKKEEPKLYPCDMCNVIMNSEIQYNQHLSSRKHTGKSKLAKRQLLRKSFVPMKNGGGYLPGNFNSRFRQNETNQPNQNNNIHFRNPFYSHNSNINSSSNNIVSNNFKKPFRNFNNLPKDSRFRPNLGNNVGPPWFNSSFPPRRSF